MIINILFYFFSIILLLSSVMVITVQNTIYSVLSLVLCFISSSIILCLLESEFIALIFIIIYVGAIAVLFLFVVMMLDLKTISLTKDAFKYFPVGSFVGLVFFVEIIFILFQNYKLNPYFGGFLTNYYSNWFDKIDLFSELVVLGQILYTFYVLPFLITGLILLLAVVGAVVLTIKSPKGLVKEQKDYRQLSRVFKGRFYAPVKKQ